MLRTVIDDNLRLMGQSREITNRIQKLRKSSGVSIEDQIEIFHSAPQGEILGSALDKFSDKIRGLVKMPFLPEGNMQPGQVVIGKTVYEFEKDEVTLYVCKQTVHVNEA